MAFPSFFPNNLKRVPPAEGTGGTVNAIACVDVTLCGVSGGEDWMREASGRPDAGDIAAA